LVLSFKNLFHECLNSTSIFLNCQGDRPELFPKNGSGWSLARISFAFSPAQHIITAICTVKIDGAAFGGTRFITKSQVLQECSDDVEFHAQRRTVDARRSDQ